ncbi:two-component system, OmpR family, response regulator RegX3 [Sulfobacillus thermosulfidooxidans DSM 9293]|uniref:Stage 0 sporulation protein A homolog n=1 Tax=Sulfobacillus thermosulfidooxidans (strain DSM 9293 / VKM B-1269 / AT-1) TaxID=929705 RepID=A0A1W1WBR8_SULTA|nr:response regulator transcription factor [Sulfobacillus thermosulfidooxidans]SMC03744.1 two-component system, OmpR family, response regulator RegX3 [Sulfobacillus thermosulfidooxidans DSM 9293]
MAGQQSINILVVAERERDRLTWSAALEHFGLTVIHVATGHDGIRELRQGGIDVVILERRISDPHGLIVCQEMRRHSATPIVMIADTFDEWDEVAAFRMGASDYLTKPVAIGRLLSRIYRLARAGPHIADAARDADEFLVYLDQQIVSFKGHELTLSARETKLLEVLFKAPKVILTRESLLDQVWGLESLDLEVRTVDVAIARLRKKLQDHFSINPIETVIGTGYRYRSDVLRVRFVTSQEVISS